MDTEKIRDTSAWSADDIECFLLESTIPIRLSCLSASGAPLICSLWYLYDDGALWCATQKTALIVSCLEKDSRCGFEISPDAPPYHGVRGQSRASLHDDVGADVLRRLIDRYLGSRESRFAQWLIRREEDEVAIRIEPAWITAWDYSRRMSA